MSATVDDAVVKKQLIIAGVVLGLVVGAGATLWVVSVARADERQAIEDARWERAAAAQAKMSPAQKLAVKDASAAAAAKSRLDGEANMKGPRKQLAAKIERVLRKEGHNVSAFAFGDAMNVDYAKCGPNSVDAIKDVWGDQIRDLGLKQIVCTGVGGQKSIASL